MRKASAPDSEVISRDFAEAFAWICASWAGEANGVPKAFLSSPVSSISRFEMTLVSWPSWKTILSGFAVRVSGRSRWSQFLLRTSTADLPRS